MRLSIERTTTMPCPTTGEDSTSVEAWPSTSPCRPCRRPARRPCAPPTTSMLPSEPTPAVSGVAALMRHSWRPVAASTRAMAPSAPASDHGIADHRRREHVVRRLADVELPCGAHGHRAFQLDQRRRLVALRLGRERIERIERGAAGHQGQDTCTDKLLGNTHILLPCSLCSLLPEGAKPARTRKGARGPPGPGITQPLSGSLRCRRSLRA